MEHKDIVQQMINFNQTLFDNAFKTTVQIQDQVETIGNTLMDQAGWLPGEGRKVYENSVEAFKDGRSNFKTYVDEGFQQAEKLFK